MIEVGEMDEKGLFTFYKEQEEEQIRRHPVKENSSKKKNKKKGKKNKESLKEGALKKERTKTQPSASTLESIKQAQSPVKHFLKQLRSNNHKNIFEGRLEQELMIQPRFFGKEKVIKTENYEKNEHEKIHKPKQIDKKVEKMKEFSLLLEPIHQNKSQKSIKRYQVSSVDLINQIIEAKLKSQKNHNSVKQFKGNLPASKSFLQRLKFLEKKDKYSLINNNEHLQNFYLPKSRINTEEDAAALVSQKTPVCDNFSQAKTLKLTRDNVKLPILQRSLSKKTQLKTEMGDSSSLYLRGNKKESSKMIIIKQLQLKKQMQIKHVGSRARELYRYSIQKCHSGNSSHVSTIDMSKHCSREKNDALEWIQKRKIIKSKLGFNI